MIIVAVLNFPRYRIIQCYQGIRQILTLLNFKFDQNSLRHWLSDTHLNEIKKAICDSLNKGPVNSEYFINVFGSI